MIVPTKHQNLQDNVLVIGAEVLDFIKKEGPTSVEHIYQKIKKKHNVRIDTVLDTITFLWLIEAVLKDNKNLVFNQSES
ncbi:MAG: hypothetical protein RIF34_06540 [Candidatus Kapaibacterium sp.]